MLNQSRAPKTPSKNASEAVPPRRAAEPRLPRHADLPIREGAPEGAAWGVFGDDDQVGTINLLTPAG